MRFESFRNDANAAASQVLSADSQKKLAVLKASPALLYVAILGLEAEQMQQQPFLAYLKGAELQGDLAGDLVLKLAVDVEKPEMVEPLQKLGDGLLGFAKQMDLWAKSPKPLKPEAKPVLKTLLLWDQMKDQNQAYPDD